jgi:hypothetical protein
LTAIGHSALDFAISTGSTECKVQKKKLLALFFLLSLSFFHILKLLSDFFFLSSMGFKKKKNVNISFVLSELVDCRRSKRSEGCQGRPNSYRKRK